MKSSYIIAAFLLVIFSTSVKSQTTAVKTEIKPVIDGFLENIWMNASKFSDFKQVEPDILADATMKTVGYFLYDEENIYIAMKMYQDVNTLRSSNGRKDAEIVWDGDYMFISIDPLNNYSQAYFFGVNAVNAVFDGQNIDENGTAILEWDGIFISGAHISDNYWSVELQIPLNTINFQEKEVQDWNVMFFRRYRENHEKAISNSFDINSPFHISNYTKLKGLKNLSKEFKFKITPYIYSHKKTDFLTNSSILKCKSGGEIKYSPSSSMTILATVNPDYAQIETDKEVINVGDLPTDYPEKRPFFIESSDFYPGIAVNTRNIVDIKTGIKIKKLGDNLKYDVTGVLDGDNNQWLLSNIKMSESNSYVAEIVGGIKNQKSRSDYNITSHIKKWFLQRRLRFSNWIGTINSPKRGFNSWELLMFGGWDTRNFGLTFTNHMKSQYFNPNIIGWNVSSNSNKYSTAIRYSIINNSGFLRTVHIKSNPICFDLIKPKGNSYWNIYLGFESIIHPSDYLGNWSFNFSYYVPTIQKFRYRNVDDYKKEIIYQDEISDFVLIDDKHSSIKLELSSDNSKYIGFNIYYDNSHVRKSKANLISSEIFWKISSGSFISYSLDYIYIAGSNFQDKFEQIIHRIHAEYNFSDKINIRAIIQPNIWKRPFDNHDENYLSEYNLTISWEYMNGSYLYLVYSNYKNSNRSDGVSENITYNGHTFALKINKSFSF